MDFERIKNMFSAAAKQFTFPHCIIDIIDILIVATIIFYIVKFIRDRRASKLAMGVLLVVLLMSVSWFLDMRALSFMFKNIVQVGLIAIIILFQPELRSVLEKFGGVSFIKTISESKNPALKHSVVTAICEAASELSREYTGALIVIERSTPLGEIIKTGTVVNADVTVPLLKNIFFNKAPLHDGAVIIRGGRICAAGCFLPMSTNDDIIKDLGTRHRAAIGMSEVCDATIIVVSEETGQVSVAQGGQLKRNLTDEQLLEILREMQHSVEEENPHGKAFVGRRAKDETKHKA